MSDSNACKETFMNKILKMPAISSGYYFKSMFLNIFTLAEPSK